MSEKILLVDDDQNLLDAIRRQLRNKYDVEYARGPTAALEALDRVPIAVAISDMQMPEINGLKLLSTIKDRSPDTVRIMLTGNADQKTAVEAINTGNIFRFLNKPCDKESLVNAIESGLKQFRLVSAERELLSETLNRSIGLLNDVLGVVSPVAFGRANRLKKMVGTLVQELPEEARWQVELAAGLSQIGWVTIPAEVAEKYERGEPLGEDEQRMVRELPQASSKFISQIPRLDGIANIIEQQAHRDDEPAEGLEPAMVQCIELLDLVMTCDQLAAREEPADVLLKLKSTPRFAQHKTWIDRLAKVINSSAEESTVMLDQLKDHMVLAQDLCTVAGTLIVPQGQVVTESLISRLRNYDANQGIKQPISVYLNDPATKE